MKKIILLALSGIIGLNVLNAQVKKSFTQRSSLATPGKLIYNIKGDFAMIGNTNMTLQTYNNTTNNSNNNMIYVDVDGDPNTLNSSSATLQFSTENGANPVCSRIIYAGLYWTGRASNGSNSPESFTVTKGSVTKQYNKRVVSIKGPASSSYTQLTANPGNIYYPENGDGFMYSAYIEITDYVKQNGLGAYTVADIALIEGNGGSTGYYGGWGMIVVYENSKMNWRDVTVFDGHAYVTGNTSVNYELPVSGFNTVQAGPVNLKLGLMAGEGDVGISGDYFKIRNHTDNAWVDLYHSNNSTTNFFNSSVNIGGAPRNPNLQNNTGLDMAMFYIPNAGNSVITNNQTSTKFQYGSTQDTYIIFCIAMAVDAYVPDVELLVAAETINGVPVGSGPLSVQPGQDIEYKMQVKNLGTEPVNNTRFVVPIPFTCTYVSNSIDTVFNFAPPPAGTNVYHDPNNGPTGAIIWDFGTLPMPPVGFPDSVLAELTFHFTVTTDCNILKNPDCPPKVTLSGGTISGTGAISGANFSNMPFIQGYQQSGACAGEPITDPLEIAIDGATYISNNCQNTPLYRAFDFCNYILPTIPVSAIASGFPPGIRFFNTNNITPTSIEYDSNNPFPATTGTSTYFGIPVGVNACYYTFTINVSNITSVPSVTNVNYCINDIPLPLTATVTDTSYTLYFYTSPNSTVALPSLTPSTSIAGTTTYYVAEGFLNGCISPNKSPITVTVYNLQAAVDTSTATHVACFGGSTGSATVAVTGGSGGYTYSWNTMPVQTTVTATNLSAGYYTVYVTDNVGCTTPIASTVQIKEPSGSLSAALLTQTNVYCKGGNTGSATVSAGGGSGTYLYSWNTSPVQTNATATGLSANIYTVTVTDNNGCTVPSIVSVTITEPANPLTSGISSQTNVLCRGDSTGSATVAAVGGSGIYSYLWSTLPVQTTATATGLKAGTYTVTVSDNNGCTLSVNTIVTITEPASNINVSLVSQQNVSCNGNSDGSAVVIASGGSGSFSYSWNTVPAQTTNTATGLAAGNYTAYISDNNGCAAYITTGVVITQPAVLNASSSLSLFNSYNVSCYGSKDGSITITVNGGNLPYTYQWSGNSTATTQNLSSIGAGIYQLVITDLKGCTYSLSDTLIEPSALQSALAITSNYNGYSVSCYGALNGALDLSVSGGTPGYSYLWTNGSTQQDISNIGAGIYIVTITDTNNCSLKDTIVLTEPAQINITAQVTSVNCYGDSTGAINITVNGGVGPYTFSWNNGSTMEDIAQLTAGNYIVTITDTNGCIKLFADTIKQNTQLTIANTFLDVKCNGQNTGAIDILVNGGVPLYQYSWSTGSTGEDVGGLPAGSYTVLVTDSKGCSTADTIKLTEPPVLSGTLNPYVYSNGYNISLFNYSDGSIDLTVNGGTMPFFFNWSNGSVNEDLLNVPAGYYSVLITDANGCFFLSGLTLKEPFELEMPTGFTPNGDGYNDLFVVHGLESYPENELEIYNRWGNIVYQQKNYFNNWNGTNNKNEALPEGTYFAILKIKLLDITLTGYVDIRR